MMNFTPTDHYQADQPFKQCLFPSGQTAFKKPQNKKIKKTAVQKKQQYKMKEIVYSELPIQDVVTEDNEALGSYAFEYLSNEGISYLKAATTDQRLLQNIGNQMVTPTLISKTPNLFPCQTPGLGGCSPTNLNDLRSSQRLNQVFSRQSNPQQFSMPQPPLSLASGHKSHRSHDQVSSMLRKKKKPNGTAVATLLTSACSSNTNKKPIDADHKKSQSLYNKKGGGIFSGFQQTLGAIVNKVKDNKNSDNFGKKSEQAAMQTQKRTNMTSFNSKTESNSVKREKPINHLKRKTLTLQSSKVNVRESLNACCNRQKQFSSDFKGCENTLNDNKNQNQCSKRMSIDFSQQKILPNQPQHQRTMSVIPWTKVKTLSQQHQFKPHKMKTTLQSQTNSSVEDVPSRYNIYQSDFETFHPTCCDDISDQNYNSNPQSLSTKNINRITQALCQQQCQSALKNISRVQVSVDGQPHIKRNAQTIQNSGQNSILSPSILDLTKQSNTVFSGQTSLFKKSSEKLSEAAFIQPLKKNKQQNFLTKNNQVHIDSYLKSTASSPSLRNNYGQATKKSHHNSQSSTVLDLIAQNQHVATVLVQQQQKPIGTKKKKLIALQKKIQSEYCKPLTSETQPLTKINCFQQLMCNKNDQQQQLQNIFQPHNTAQSQEKKQKVNTIQKQQHQALIQAKQQALFYNDLTQKKVSNQENILLNPNQRSPEGNTIINLQIQKQNLNKDGKRSNKEMVAFLRNLKDKSNIMQNIVQNQIKLNETESIYQRVQQQNIIKNLDMQKMATTKQVLKENKEKKSGDYQFPTQESTKRHSSHLKKSQKSTKNHKRANSEIYKPTPQQLQTSSGALNKHQMMFFSNLNHQKKQIRLVLDSLSTNNYQPQVPNPIQANPAYSARISPTNNFTTFNNIHFDYLNNAKSALPSARSDQCSDQNNVFSNKPTQKKITVQNKKKLIEENKILCENTLDQNVQHIMRVVQDNTVSQTNKIVNVFYGNNQQENLNVQTMTFSSNGVDTTQGAVFVNKCEEEKQVGSDQSQMGLNLHKSLNQSPKLKIQPVNQKLSQPEKVQHFIKDEEDFMQMPLAMKNNFFCGSSDTSDQQIQKNLECEHLPIPTFESSITNRTLNQLTPRSKDKKILMKQIKISFDKLEEPIKTSTEFYRIGKMLGKGAFGRVNLAIHKLCNQLVAVKSINKQFLSEDESQKKKLMQEVLILQKTRHDNIVRLYDSFETGKHIVFVMELCAGGDLLNYVRKRRKLKEDVAKYVFKQVVEGLAYCHSKGIVHRDMKLDNILLNEQGKVKICDFGVSKQITTSIEIMTEQCGTPAYIAPEILKDKGYKGFGVDIWSLGVCLYAMLCGTVPFKASNMTELHSLIMKGKYNLKEDNKSGEAPLSDNVKNLIKLLLEPNPEKRIDINALKQHIWLQDEVNIEIFTEQEIEMIRKDFTYQDMSRYKRNHKQKKMHSNDNVTTGNYVLTTDEPLFTEHALDSTTNALMRNCTTRSVVLAPFNSTRTHFDKEQSDQDLPQKEEESLPSLDIDPQLLMDKRVIKYAPRVKDINRQYEMNNNCELDNGVYNKFVKQTSSDNCSSNKDTNSENSLTRSINKVLKPQKAQQENQYAAPLVTQTSDDEAQLELLKKIQVHEPSELNSFVHQKVEQYFMHPTKEEQLLIDYEVVEMVQQYGYPRKFIIDSLEHYEMNDACTNYFLLEKDRHYMEDVNYFQN